MDPDTARSAPGPSSPGPGAHAADGEREPTEGPTRPLADGFNQLLESGRQIASALSPDTIFAAAKEAGMMLLRGERCAILTVSGAGDPRGPTTIACDEPPGHGERWRELGLAAVCEGRAVSWSARRGADSNTSSEAFELSAVRSALCAPIRVRGRITRCLYVDHRDVDELFGEQEQRVAEFIATLTGAALENAEGRTEVAALTRTREERVEERTAQLEDTNRQLNISLQKLTEAFDRECETAEQLKHQAFHDSLTDLANRALFVNRVEHALDRTRRLGTQLAVLFLDLDDFKTINDSFGHPVGDQLLVAVAERLRRSVRRADTAARLGGDEFGILIEDLTEAGAAIATAQRVTAALETPFTLDGKEAFVHASIGIALHRDGEREGDVYALLRNADVAMYISKGRGKRRFEVFEQTMHDELLHRLELRADLQRALEHQQFVVHYQPIVDLRSGRITGAEALIRWRHDERGLMSPADFVPLAEETGLINPIGNWVLTAACRQARAWQQGPRRGEQFTVAVNLSARELREPGLVASVEEALSISGLPPESLVLEITESVLMHDTDATISRLRALKELGLRLAIDDFGSGYSSLGYLKRFPVDILKIAKPFVDDVAHGSEEAALAGAIVNLADTLNLRTVAEGIEHDDQLRRLQHLGCDLGQGYYLACPQVGAEIEKLLSDADPLESLV